MVFKTMEEDYLKSCRFCLKDYKDMPNLYSLSLEINSQVSLVDFVRKITDLKISKGEFLPNGICPTCIEITQKTYHFTQQCIVSDNILKKHETRREFRKIEQEALLEEPEEDGQIILVQDDQSEPQGEHNNSPNLNPSEIDIKDSKILDYTNNIENISDSEPERNDSKFVPEPQILDLSLEHTSKNQALELKEQYTCSPCTLSFSNKLTYLNHKRAHDTTKPFRCSECPQTFFKQVHLAVHVRCHTKTEEKPFSCKTCGKQYMYQYLVKQHELKHTGERPFPCPTCNKGCFSQNSLKRHISVHAENYIKKMHQCQVCQKTFTYPSYLTEHMKIHNGDKPHLCPTCGKGFKQVGQLHVHQMIHSGLKPFKCSVCLERFISNSKLKIHIRKHTKEKPFVCEQCGMAFRQSYDLKMHIRTHSSEKPVQCSICSKKMATTGQLTVHLRTHTGERPYSCVICKKSFAINTTLTKHYRTHSGERPYKCDVCFKDFTQASILKCHKKTHDNPTADVKKPHKIRRRNRLKKKQNGIKNEPKQSGGNILTLSGGATVRIAVPEAVPGVLPKNHLEEDVGHIVILPAPIPLLTK